MKLKIAYFVSNRTIFPPDPGEVSASSTVVGDIIKNLSPKHDITVYAPIGSKMKGVNIKNCGLKPYHLGFNLSDTEWTTRATVGMRQIFLGKLFSEADQYDIIHIHTEPIYLGMPYISLISTPVLFTSHNPVKEFEKPIYEHFADKVNLSAVSKNQALTISSKIKIPYIHNAIEVNKYSCNFEPKSYYLFLGRIVKEKGIETFLKVIQTNRDLAFKVVGTGKPEYENELRIEVAKSAKLEFINKIVHRETAPWFELFKNAKALIAPIEWEEPFGLTFIEAMGCGTPVIAFKRGAASEIIDHNVNGLLVDSKKGHTGISEAINKLEQLEKDDYIKMRHNARATVENKFSTQIMASKYERLYYELINKKGA